MPDNTLYEPSKQKGHSRVETVYQGVLQLIKDNDLKEGDRLPSEARLAELFSISRPIVRQSLTRLQEAGVIDIRWGSGSYLKRASSWHANAALNLAPLNSLDGVRHTFEIRIALESEAAALAAERASPHSIKVIRNTHERFLDVEARKKEGSESADQEFHLAISQATSNPFFAQMLVNAREPIRLCSRIGRMLAVSNADERYRRICAEHQRIVDAIVDGNVEAARSAMHSHVVNACQRVFQGLTPGDGLASNIDLQHLSSDMDG